MRVLLRRLASRLTHRPRNQPGDVAELPLVAELRPCASSGSGFHKALFTLSRIVWRKITAANSGRFIAFLLSNVIQKFGQVILLVGVVYFGSTQDVYRFALFISVFNLIVPLITLNVHMSGGRILFDIENASERADFTVSIWVAGVLAALVGTMLVAGALLTAEVYDPLTKRQPMAYVVMIVAVVIFVSSQFWIVIIRIEDRAAPVVTFGALVGAGSPGLFALGLLLGLPPLVAGVAGFCAGQFAGTAYATWACKASLSGGRLSGKNLGLAVRYSSGTVIFAISQWMTNYSGRWIANGHLSTGELATYTLVGQFMVAFTMTLSTIYESRRPVILRAFSSGNEAVGSAEIAKCQRLSFMAVAVVFVVILICYPIIRFLLPVEFPLELTWLFAAFVNCVAYAISMRTFWVSMALHRTRSFGLAAVLGGGATVIVSILLVPHLGVNGLFLGGMSGLLLQSVLGTIVLRSRRSHPA